MIKKVLIIGGISLLVLIGAISLTIMLYSPKQSQAFVPTLEIEPTKEKAQNGAKSRYEILKDAKFNKPKSVEKKIAPVFEIAEILTKSKKEDSLKIANPIDSNAFASMDTVAIIEQLLAEKRAQSRVKSAKANSRVGASKSKRKASNVVRPKAKKKVNAPPAVKSVAPKETLTAIDYTADKKADKEDLKGDKEKEIYSFNYISKQAEQVDESKFVRAELSEKLKVRSGSNAIEIKLLETCTIEDKAYIQGDIMHGFSRLSGDRVQINISSITSNETGQTDFVNLKVYDNDFLEGLAYDATANNEKKRLISRTSRDLIPNRVPGANTARGLVSTIAGTVNGKFAKGYQIRIAVSNSRSNNYNNYSYNNNKNN